MPELDRQLRTYFDAATQPVDVDAIVRADRPELWLVELDERYDADSRPRRPRPALLIAAAVLAAIALGAALFVAGTRVDRSPEPADVPPFVPTTVPVVVEEVGVAARLLEPGRYRTDLLGVDVSFRVPTTMLLSSTRAGVVVLSDGLTGDLGFPPSASEWTPGEIVEIRLLRISGWSTHDESTDVAVDAASIDPNDVDTWVAVNDVTIVDEDRMLVAGRTVRVLDVEVDPDATARAPACSAAHQPCLLAASIAGEVDGVRNRAVQVSGAVAQRIFVVPIDGFDPLVIIAVAPIGSGWLDILQDDVVGSLEIGPAAAPIGVD